MQLAYVNVRFRGGIVPCMELLVICQNFVNENLQWRKSFVILPIDGTSVLRAFRGANIDYPLTSALAPINSRTTSSRPALAIHRI